MKKRLLTGLIASLMFFAPAGVFAADAPASGDKPAAPATPATPGARGGRQAGGLGGPGGFGARDPLAQLMTALGDVNLETDFTLTPEQKEKIQVIVTDFKKQMEKWRTDHEADLKKIQDDFAALRNGGRQGGGNAAGGNNRQQFQQIAQARQTLMETAPKADEAIAQIKGLLTTEQLKKLQTKIDERQAEAAQMRQQFQGAFGGGNAAGGGRGGRGGGAAGGGRGGRGGRGGGAGGAGGV